MRAGSPPIQTLWRLLSNRLTRLSKVSAVRARVRYSRGRMCGEQDGPPSALVPSQGSAGAPARLPPLPL